MCRAKLLRKSLALFVLLVTLWAATAGAATYYVANAGNDANDGTSPETPWRTLGHVNAQTYQPGDSVLLKRGDSWREQLVPASGDESGYVTYGAWGTGPKPLLIGSVRKNRPEDWMDQGGNVWATREPVADGPEILPNPSLTEDTAGWNLHSEGGASVKGGRTTDDFDSAPAGYALRCEQPGENGSHIQLYLVPFSVEAGTVYRLQFRAKATAPFLLAMPRLMSAGPPWTSYHASSSLPSYPVDATWQTYTQFYKATKTADDARLTFFFGGLLPAGATCCVDSLSFMACPSGGLLPSDVGNIIFDHEASCGVKVWNESDLDQQGEYWYDEARHLVKLYSTENPGVHYTDIECALRTHMIDESNRSYVIYENLLLKYGAAHGVGGGWTHHIIVRDCDFGFIGGGDQMGGDRTVRFGNGIEFWGLAHDNLVERCRLWEIYDAALTNQSSGPNTPQYNITYRSNIIWNSEYSFEYWNRPEESVTHDIYFDNNTCINAGHGWAHAQRPDPSGRQLCFYTSPAIIKDFHVRNNIFYEATKNAFYAPAWTPEQIAALDMDNNCWYQAEGDMIAFQGKNYTMAQFAEYQKERNKEPHSITAVPGFVDAAGLDFHLAAGSPCIDTGAPAGLTKDFDGTAIPQGAGPDIGAYEFK